MGVGNMKINCRMLGVLCVTLLFALLWPAFAAAANGGGAGDGSGRRPNQPLMVEKVVPADGAQLVYPSARRSKLPLTRMCVT